MSQPILSILIPTIEERFELCSKLFGKLFIQMGHDELVRLDDNLVKHKFYLEDDIIEVLVDDRIKFRDGGPSIGAKRQTLLDSCTGLFCGFLDDDEDIAGNYIETLIELCKQDKDVCTFKSFIQLEQYWGIVNMRLRYVNEQMSPDYEVHRAPWHMCPVRSSIAKKYKFPDENYAEDWNFMIQVLADVQTEAHSERIIHSYRHNVAAKSESDQAVAFQKQKDNDEVSPVYFDTKESRVAWEQWIRTRPEITAVEGKHELLPGHPVFAITINNGYEIFIGNGDYINYKDGVFSVHSIYPKQTS